VRSGCRPHTRLDVDIAPSAGKFNRTSRHGHRGVSVDGIVITSCERVITCRRLCTGAWSEMSTTFATHGIGAVLLQVRGELSGGCVSDQGQGARPPSSAGTVAIRPGLNLRGLHRSSAESPGRVTPTWHRPRTQSDVADQSDGQW
jgi:hypothetical protein